MTAMTLGEYYDILGIPVCSTADEIKRAYRLKARLYHPDINCEPDAKDKFIQATEAYEFLITNHERIEASEKEFLMAMEEWRKYRQGRARYRAMRYAAASYVQFRNSKLYRSTRILNMTSVIFSFCISLMVLIYTIAGYFIRIRDPNIHEGLQPIYSFLLLLTLSGILLAVSFLYLRDYILQTKRRKKKRK